MKLQDFLKELFNQPAVDGYEIGRLEVGITVNNDILYVGEDTACECATITIIPAEVSKDEAQKRFKIAANLLKTGTFNSTAKGLERMIELAKELIAMETILLNNGLADSRPA